MRRFLRVLLTLIGAAIGVGIVALVMFNVKYPGYDYALQYTTETVVLVAIYTAAGTLLGILFYYWSNSIFDSGRRLVTAIEDWSHRTPAMDILFGALGLAMGLLLAYLLSLVVRTINIPVLTAVVSAILYIGLGYAGCRFGVKRRTEILSGKSNTTEVVTPKILDTSALIDGRIYDVTKFGFLDGDIIIATFVLKELRHIADSSDEIRRNKGRYGLDIIKSLQKDLGERVKVVDKDYPDMEEVDMKLVEMAKEMDGVLVTTDYNLNKVATVQSRKVLNINDLAGAMRPVILPGETVEIKILKEGKENGQGVGYLDDGTMVIIEGGKYCLGQLKKIEITSSLQTSAGRMVFGKVAG